MMNNYRWLTVVWIVAVMPLYSVAAPLNAWFEKANHLYEQQDYDSAAVYYHKIVDAGVHNSAVFYNLGNSYYRQHEIGRAILFYEKARTLAPLDEDIINNIKFANLNIVDRVPEPDRSLVDSFFRRLHRLLPLSTQLWLLLGLLTFLSLLFAFGLFASRNLRLWLIYLSSIIIIAVAGIGISAGFKIYAREQLSYAVVLQQSVKAKNEPRGDKILFTAHEGTKFRVRRTMDNWALVSLPNGVSGWVKRTALGRI